MGRDRAASITQLLSVPFFVGRLGAQGRCCICRLVVQVTHLQHTWVHLYTCTGTGTPALLPTHFAPASITHLPSSSMSVPPKKVWTCLSASPH